MSLILIFIIARLLSFVSISPPPIKQSEAKYIEELRELKRTENSAVKMKNDELVILRKEKSDIEKKYHDVLTKIGLNDQSMMNDEAKTYNSIVAYNAKLDINSKNKMDSAAAAQQNKILQYSFYKNNRKYCLFGVLHFTQLNSLPPSLSY